MKNKTKVFDIAHADVFRRIDGDIEFLIILRAPLDGDFWQTVTGTVEPGEDIRAALEREITEEIGVIDLLHISPEIYTFDWLWGLDAVGRDHCYAVEIVPDAKIILSHEHTHFKWLSLKDAIKLVKYDGAKKSLHVTYEYAKSLSA